MMIARIILIVLQVWQISMLFYNKGESHTQRSFSAAIIGSAIGVALFYYAGIFNLTGE